MKNYIITFVVGLVIGILLVNLFPSRFINCERLYCYSDTIKDIEYIKGKTDTVEVPVFVKSTLRPDTIYRPLEDSSVFISAYKDTIIDATVTSRVKNNIVVDQRLAYTLSLKDKFIYRTDTIKQTNTVFNKEKGKILLAVNISTDLHFIQAGPSLGYQTKKGMITEVGYNFNKKYGNNVLFGIKIPIIYTK